MARKETIDLDPRSDKTINRLKEEAAKRKIVKDSAKKYRQDNMKSSGRGDGMAELMDLHENGRKKETIRKGLELAFTGAHSLKPFKKAKGGMISTKRYMNGGMVMSGRGVRDTKMG
jgi:hypothetical protein